MAHEEVSVKVNARIDVGVAPLVSALNEFPQVITVESCEGDGEREAYVSFHIGDDWHDWRALGEFTRRLSESLGKDERLADLWYSLSFEWYAGGVTPLGYLRVPRQHVTTVADAIRLSAELSK